MNYFIIKQRQLPFYEAQQGYGYEEPQLVMETTSLEDAVATWYALLDGKDLDSDEGWCNQSIVGYTKDGLTLKGFATEYDCNDSICWTLGTIIDNKDDSVMRIYARAKKN